MTPELVHNVVFRLENSKCGTSGHYDEIAECSCGQFEHTNSHQTNNEGRVFAVLGHRLEVIESMLAIRFSIEHKGHKRGGKR